jgi:hypothetical protein
LQADPNSRSETIYIGTSTELYERQADEAAWKTITDGLAFWNGPQFQNLAIGTTDLWMGTESGLFQRHIGASGWRTVEALQGKKITALLARSNPDLLYAWASGDGLFVSRDHGTSWTLTGTDLKKAWIRVAAFHPSAPRVMFAGASVLGFFKSRDGGNSWQASNRGLTETDVRALAVDAGHPNIIYAGTHGAGMFKSTDGGNNWKLLVDLPFVESARLSGMLDAQAKSVKQTIAPPAVFNKCNQCHGWSDVRLNLKPTPWRVAANKRDWKRTVARMSEGTDIRPEEQAAIVRLLEQYTEHD